MLAVLLTAAVLADVPRPATDVRIEAFTAACVPHRQDNMRAAEALARDGWTPVGDDDHPELDATMARVRAEADDPEYPMEMAYSAWRREMGGRRLYVVLSRVDATIGRTEDSDGDGVIQEWEKATDFSMLGCGVWDFDATAPVDPALMTAWAGAEPVQVVDQPGVISGGTWNVHEALPGSAEVHMGFMPEGSVWPMSGVSITMSSVPIDE